MKLTIDIDAVPQGRPRFTRTGFAYDPPQSRQFKVAFGQLVLSQLQGTSPMCGALKVTIRIFRAADKFKKGATSKRYGDIDNILKGILDALTATKAVWLDDKQIVELHVYKGLAATPKVELEIEEVV